MGTSDVPRAPRIGVDPGRLAFHGIDFAASECRLVKGGVEVSMKLDSILNVAIGGMKIVVGDIEQNPVKGDTVLLSIRGRERSWNIKGRAAWVDPIVGGQWWLGIEFVFSADCAAFFKIFSA